MMERRHKTPLGTPFEERPKMDDHRKHYPTRQAMAETQLGTQLNSAVGHPGSSNLADGVDHKGKDNTATPLQASTPYLPSPVSFSPSSYAPQYKPRRVHANGLVTPIPSIDHTPNSLGHRRSGSTGLAYPPGFGHEVDWSRISREAPTPNAGPYRPGQYRVSRYPPSSARTTQDHEGLYDSSEEQQDHYVGPNRRTLTRWISDNLQYCQAPVGGYSAPANFLVQIESFLKGDFKHHTYPPRWTRETILDAIHTAFPEAVVASSSSNPQEPPKITGLSMKPRGISEDDENDDDHSTLIDGSLQNRPSMGTRSHSSEPEEDNSKPNYQKGYEILNRGRLLDSPLIGGPAGSALDAFASLAAVQERSPEHSPTALPLFDDHVMVEPPSSDLGIDESIASIAGAKRKRSLLDEDGTSPKRSAIQLPPTPAFDLENDTLDNADEAGATPNIKGRGRGKAKATPRKRAPVKPKAQPKGKSKSVAPSENAEEGPQIAENPEEALEEQAKPKPKSRGQAGLKHVKLKTTGLYPGIDHCPHETYSVSCYKVLKASKYGRLRIQGIYNGLKKMYPYYATLSSVATTTEKSEVYSFKNSIRHNLSLRREYFFTLSNENISQRQNDPDNDIPPLRPEEKGGKGGLWHIVKGVTLDTMSKKRSTHQPGEANGTSSRGSEAGGGAEDLGQGSASGSWMQQESEQGGSEAQPGGGEVAWEGPDEGMDDEGDMEEDEEMDEGGDEE